MSQWALQNKSWKEQAQEDISLSYASVVSCTLCASVCCVQPAVNDSPDVAVTPLSWLMLGRFGDLF